MSRREGGDATTETEMGVKQSQVKGYIQPPEADRGIKWMLS